MGAPRSLSPETAQRAAAVARALVGAARNAALYSPDHPAARAAITRLSKAVADATSGDFITLGVAPDALLVDGEPVGTDGIVAEAAAYLHARDLLRISFTGRVDDETLYALMRLLADDVA